MEDRIRLSYFYGKEADQFSFYKIPKLLFTEEYFKKIGSITKLMGFRIPHIINSAHINEF